MLTLAMANLTGYSGDGHIKLAASVEFMHTATLLHDEWSTKASCGAASCRADVWQ